MMSFHDRSSALAIRITYFSALFQRLIEAKRFLICLASGDEWKCDKTDPTSLSGSPKTPSAFPLAALTPSAPCPISPLIARKLIPAIDGHLIVPECEKLFYIATPIPTMGLTLTGR